MGTEFDPKQLLLESGRFEEGRLIISDEEQEKEHGERSRLFYGIDERGIFYSSDWGLIPAPKHPYFVNLEDLKKIEKFKIPYIWRNIDGHTSARKTITGGLKVKGNFERAKGIRLVSTFSRDEYEQIKKFLKH